MNNQANNHTAKQPGLEGEGSRTADRRYRRGVRRTVQEGHVEENAKRAAEALDGPEGEELREAEEAARRGHSR